MRLGRPLDIPPGQSEYEIIDYFRDRAAENAADYASFLGAGVYRHYRPVVIDPLATRGEFLTSYTPYQAEISQGILTTIFEFQTMVCQLTGMEVANASMYDGSTAVPEAAMMAVRITGRDKILVARTLHPEYRQVLETYHRHQDSALEEVGYDPATGQIDLEDLEAKLNGETAAVIVQSPNFFGCIESTREAAATGAQAWRFAGGDVHRSGFAGIAAAAGGGRYRCRGVAVVRASAQLRRAVCRRSGDQGTVTSGRSPGGWSAKPSIRTATGRFA